MRSSTDVQNRVLVAARVEFAERGLAGARIDRIAQGASASKERLYAHFGDKLTLFRAVLDLNAVEFHSAIPLDPLDVPGFVAAAFDHTVAFPEHDRMLTWARLEGIAYRLPTGLGAPQDKIEALREAQRIGTVDSTWRAEDLLELLFALAHAWVHTPIRPEDRVTSTAEHRLAAVEAARRLIAKPV